MARKNTEDFERNLKRLAQIVEELESEATPLERGLELYKEGAALVTACRERLESARNEVEILSKGVFEPFDSDDAGEGE